MHPRAAFTLIELVIVIVIIGIIAAIAVPRMGNAAQNSRVSTAVSNLQALRKAVDLFTAEHEGRTPNYDETNTRTDDPDSIAVRLTKGPGNDGVTGGPYLAQIPFNPFAQSNTIVMSKNFDRASGAGAWSYDFMTDELWNDAPLDQSLWSVPGAKALLGPGEWADYDALIK